MQIVLSDNISILIQNIAWADYQLYEKLFKKFNFFSNFIFISLFQFNTMLYQVWLLLCEKHHKTWNIYVHKISAFFGIRQTLIIYVSTSKSFEIYSSINKIFDHKFFKRVITKNPRNKSEKSCKKYIRTEKKETFCGLLPFILFLLFCEKLKSFFFQINLIFHDTENIKNIEQKNIKTSLFST